MTYSVLVPLDVSEPNRATVASLLHDVLAERYSRLEALVKVTDSGIEVTLQNVNAETPRGARRKALYWLERAARVQRALRWNGAMTGDVQVTPWT